MSLKLPRHFTYHQIQDLLGFARIEHKKQAAIDRTKVIDRGNMETISIQDLQQRAVVRCVRDTLGTTPVWIHTERLMRGAILATSKAPDRDSLHSLSSSIDMEVQK